MTFIKLMMPTLAMTLLAACGGGGGGGGVAPIPTFSVTGSAAKGILKMADVQAYELVSGVLVQYGSPTTTDNSGAYTLKLTSTTNPLIIKITANTRSKMLDETTVVSGKFVEINAPSDLVLRSMIPDLTAPADVQANPFTEMAIAGALAATDSSGAAVTLTRDVLLISKEAIKIQYGINPFALKAVDADSTTATTDQKKLMTLLTGVAKSAKDDSACSTTCQVTKLGATAAIKFDKTTGQGNFKNPSGMATASNSLSAKAATVNNPLVVTLPTYSAVRDADIVSSSEISARDSFKAFIDVMREGVTTAGDTLETSGTVIDNRTKGLTFQTFKAGMDAFNAATASCSFPATTLVCSGANVTGSNGTYALTYTSGGFLNTLNASGTLSGGIANLSITGSSSAISSGNKAGELAITARLTGMTSIDSTPDSAKLNIELTGYDDVNVKPIVIKLTDLTLTANQTTKAGSIAGDLSISNSYNDKLSGSVAIDFVGLGPNSNSLEAYPKSATLRVTGYGDNKTLVTLDLVAQIDYTTYKPWLLETSSNPLIGSANVKLALMNDGVKLDITGNQTGYQKGNYKVIFESAGKSITATTVKGSNDVLFTSSSGDFTAALTKTVNGSVSGVIKKGNVQVGTVERGMIKVDGQELSFK